LSSHNDTRIQRMAECFLESWFVKSRRGVGTETTPENDKGATQIVNE
jgi:hypothetical protein